MKDREEGFSMMESDKKLFLQQVGFLEDRRGSLINKLKDQIETLTVFDGLEDRLLGELTKNCSKGESNLSFGVLRNEIATLTAMTEMDEILMRDLLKSSTEVYTMLQGTMVPQS